MLEWGKALLKKRFNKPGNVYLGLVHRLDRPASGVMVFARTSKAAGRLGKQFRERTVEKRYAAIVEGAPGEKGHWVDFIRKMGRQPEIVPEGAEGARRAVLTWRAVHVAREKTLVEIHLESGRPHQIRLQFASRHFPVLGDVRYGASATLDDRSLALHCIRLGIEHPVRREKIAWQAMPPATWPAIFRDAAADLIATY